MSSLATKSCAIIQETLSKDIKHIVCDSDLHKITQRSVFQRLQDKYGIPLTQFKPFIYERAVEEARIRMQSSLSSCSDDDRISVEAPPLKKRRINSTQSKRENQKDIVYQFSDAFKTMMKKDRGSWRECWQWINEYADSNDLRIGNRKIRCDYVLKGAFKRNESSVNGISRLIWNHLMDEVSVDLDHSDDNNKVKTGKRKYRKRERDKNGQIIKKRKNSGLTRLCFMSKELQDIVGDSRPLARNKITKAFWDYLQVNGLKKPGRIILCDERLKKIWGQNTHQVHMYYVQRGLKEHITTMSKDEENKYKHDNPHLFKEE